MPRARRLEEKEALIHTLQEALGKAENNQRSVTTSPEEKEILIQILLRAVEGAANDRYMLARLEEKDVLLQKQRQELDKAENERRQFIRDFEKKEAVIQELNQALNAYRSAFSALGFVVRPVNRVVSAARLASDWSRNMLAPRLGNLDQYAPRELRLPRYYTRPLHVAQPPRISIVTPSFKQARFIGRTIKSVLDQSYPNLEYCVQDGGSEDGTIEILERYADRLAGWESRPDSGQSNAINLGFAKTSGEIMAWLNSDDLMLPGALAYVARFFNRYPTVDVVYGHRILIDENDQQIGRWVMPAHNDEVLSWADYIPQETLFWRRRIWDKVGGNIDESFRFAMDWDLLVRFRKAGAKFRRLPRFLGAFRVHPHQKTSAAITDIGHEEMTRIRTSELGHEVSYSEIAQAIRTYLLRHVATDLRYRIMNKMNSKMIRSL